VVIEQARRRRQIALLSRKAAHFREKSQRADSLIADLRRAALTDPLTGLANRRAFDDHLGDVIAAVVTGNETACLAMIDIDYFKAVNDRHGHASGDAVLRQFADLALASLRSDDLVSRIGGEEFAVILRALDLDQACKVCQRLVDRVAGHVFDTPAGPVRVTISTGVAMIGADAQTALAAADAALYAAKRAGRARLSAVA
jgi:diguanylate cyclase (GGDEF)-like protein